MMTEQTQSLRLKCASCTFPVAENDIFCGKCGFPLKGTEDEITEFNYTKEVKRFRLEDADRLGKKSTRSLFIIAAIFFASGLLYYFINIDLSTSLAVLITNSVLAVIFLLLAVWSKDKPVAAFICALVLYSVVQLLNAFLEPSTIYRGIILKVAIIVWLVKGLQSAFEIEKTRKESKIG